LLQQTQLDPEQADYSRILGQSGEGLLTLINDILDFSKIEAGKLTIEAVEFDLRNLIDSVLELLQTNAAEKKLPLMVQWQTGLPHHFKGDPGRVRQIILNLMSNALKFTKEGFVRIGVSGEKQGERFLLKIWVQDTGIGISQEAQKRLFQSFSQAESDTSRKFGGTGLGLVICLKLAELMGGGIKLNSEIGQGSTFTLEIPIPEAKVVAPTDLQVKNWSGTVLILASSEIGRLALVDECETMQVGHQVVQTWEQAHNYFESPKSEDCARVLFVHMPMKQFVIEFDSGAWRNHPPLAGITCIYFTHTGMRGDAQRVREHGFDGFISLPMKSGLLGQLLSAIIRRGYQHQPNLPLITRFNVNDSWIIGEAETPKSDSERPAWTPVPKSTSQTKQPLLGRVLIVDDNVVNLRIASQMLKAKGLEAQVAHQGQEAIELIASSSFDLILMDCEMPVLNGWDATSKIREQFSSSVLPIVGFSANNQPEEKAHCLKVGMNDVLAKPLNPVDLEGCLRTWLRPS
jgi:CheY-like chemotaxis protein